MKNLNLSLDSIEPFFQKIAGLPRIQRILICVVAVLLLIGGFGFFSYMPKFDEMSKLRTEIKTVQEKLNQTKRSASEYAKYKEKFEDAKAQFAVISRALPNTEEIPSLLTSISQAGKTSGLTFVLFQPLSENKKDFYSEIPIKMELTGTYHELGVFFDKLAQLSRIVNIDNCTTLGESSSLKISCTGVTYKFVEQSNKPKKK